MKIYKCSLNDLVQRIDHWTARITMLEHDKERNYKIGDCLMTSRIDTIDFGRGIIVTQNSIYQFK